MNERIQEHVEEFLLNSKTNPNSVSLENEYLKDSQFKEHYQKTAILQEALLRANVRSAVNKARQEAMQTNKTKFTVWRYAASSSAIAAGVAIFFLLKPIDVGNPEDVLRGEISADDKKIGLSSEELALVSAQNHIQANENTQAIALLEPLVKNTAIREYHHNRISWLLSVAYLQNKQPKKAEELFETIVCEGEGCGFDNLEALKLKSQILVEKLKFDE